MLRGLIRSSALPILVVSLAALGVATAGVDCPKSNAAKAAAPMGSHCLIAKNITKTAKLTSDGAVVKLEGKTDEAVGHIKEHLEMHAAGENCPDCPLSMDGVTTKVKLTSKGGKVTVKADSTEAIKAVQEWAQKPAGSCCAHRKTSA